MEILSLRGRTALSPFRIAKLSDALNNGRMNDYGNGVEVHHNGYTNGSTALAAAAALFPRATEVVVAGSSAGVFPEDYNEAGALWEHLDRHRVPFFNFGFGAAGIAVQFREALADGVTPLGVIPLLHHIFGFVGGAFAPIAE